ncbi:hypothetical protein K1W69_06795 [Hoeflea sp. WL0058]|uniref:Uncharacterized protein n=1 Tax=Flavimaribacter sediminis TaxID=2865987 RepID=A0AAE3CZ17_9HYPH|nr:hypothetical protein [Flavimaribacter sediminis]MBW8636890.1 hypothetical protein [Flavimaribacter sediminis]
MTMTSRSGLFAFLSAFFFALTIFSAPVKPAFGQDFSRPEEGATWSMRYQDEVNDITHLGEVTYSSGRYHLTLTGRLVGDKLVRLPEGMRATMTSEEVRDHEEIVFKAPKVELRMAWPSILGLVELYSREPPSWAPENSGVYPEFDAEDLAGLFPDSLKPGAFVGGNAVDGEAFGAAEAEIQGNPPSRRLPFSQAFSGKKYSSPDMVALVQMMTVRTVRHSEEIEITLPWKAVWHEGINKQLEKTIVAPTPARVTTIISSAGYEFVLKQPWKSDDSGEILWNWSMKIDGDGTFESKGGYNSDLKHVIFGEKPEILASFVAEDQLARANSSLRRALFPYPYDDEGKRVKAPLDTENVVAPDHRHLFLVGRNLTSDTLGATSDIGNEDDALTYFVSKTHRGSEGAKAFVESNAPDGSRSGLAEEVAAAAEPLGKDAEIIVLDVKLYQTVVAGEKRFYFLGEDVDWTLGFGDNGLYLRFVRVGLSPNLQPSGRTISVGRTKGSVREEARHLMMRDQIVVEAQVEGEHPLQPFEIALVRSSDGHKQLQEGTGRIQLAPVDGEKRLLRSRRYVVADREKLDGRTWADLPESDQASDVYIPKEMALALRPETTMRAVLLDNPIDLFQVRYAGDTVTISHDEKEVHGRFVDALRRSFECSNEEFAERYWEELSLEDENEISRRYYFKTSTLTTKINHGEHAALLMIRDLFVKKLRHVRDMNTRLRGNKQALLAYFERWRKRSVDPDAPKSILREVLDVPNLDGSRSFEYWLDNAEELKLTELQKVYVASVSIEKQIGYIEKALDTVGDPLDCDSPGLVSYFAGSAENLINEIVSTLMRRELNGNGVWIVQPDPVARAHFNALKSLKLQADLNAQISDQDTNMIKACLFVASAPFGFGLPMAGGALGIEATTGTLISGIAFAAEAGDAALTVAANLQTHWQDDALLEFARGASPVLGEQLLLDAEAAQSSKAMLAIDTMVSLVGAAGSALDVAKDLSNVGEGVLGASKTADELAFHRISQSVSEMDAPARKDAALAGAYWAEGLINVPNGFDPAVVYQTLPYRLKDMEPAQARDLIAFLSVKPDEFGDAAKAALQSRFMEAMETSSLQMKQTIGQLEAQSKPGLASRALRGTQALTNQAINQLAPLGKAIDESGAAVLHDLPALEYEVIDNVDGLPSPEEFLNALPNSLNAGPENLEGN